MLKTKLIPVLTLLISVSVVFGLFPLSAHAKDALIEMNDYVLKATNYLQENYSNGGYDIKKALTHDLPYNENTIKATSPPKSMCVAAMLEVIIHAMDFYAQENP